MSTLTALTFQVQAECTVSKARAGLMKLPHYNVKTPVFMPVGTQGTMKGLLPEQLEELDCEIILGNTYHLGNRPGTEVLKKVGGLHKFMGWKRALLTDSGGFQMVSLLKLAEITEEGVKFKSPYDDSEIMLTPEKSIEIQNCIGADIIMQLDDVVQTTQNDHNRIKEASERTSRWLDRCIRAHRRPGEQSIFPIIQGQLDADLRLQSAKDHMSKDVNGFAIGGLSGGEAKQDFWPMVKLGTDTLDTNKPRYLMGVGLAIDLVVCVALGVDMFDCVFPTRTARFGCALVTKGQLNLKQKQYETDLNPIDNDCSCSTCTNYTRAYLHGIVTVETVACHLISVHNIAFQMRLMRSMRESIINGTFPQFVQKFADEAYSGGNYPAWVVNALSSVGINLIMGSPERELCPPPSEEDELTLPRASINKMIKELVPSVRVAFESRELILNCCTEFIHLLSSEANEVCNQSNKKTINAEHVLTALDRLGFSDYTIEAEAVLKDCKAVAAKRRRQSTRLENLGIPEEELLRQQQELFAKAREEQAKQEQQQWLLLQQQGLSAEGTPQPYVPPPAGFKTEDDEDDDYS